MYKVLEKYLRCIHPFMPFITEEIWQTLPHEGDSIMTSPYPHVQQQLIDKKSEESMTLIFEIITSIRNMRQDLDIPVTTKVNCVIATATKAHLELITALAQLIKSLAKIETLSIENKYVHLRSSITTLVKDTHVTVPLEGLIDIDKEKTKIDSKIIQTEKEISNKEKLLSNKEFLKKAPDEIVATGRARLAELSEALKKLKAVKDGLR
jgi:valyl-tRNA synthetase